MGATLFDDLTYKLQGLIGRYHRRRGIGYLCSCLSSQDAMEVYIDGGKSRYGFAEIFPIATVDYEDYRRDVDTIRESSDGKVSDSDNECEVHNENDE